jgi:GAF domain-containing protein
MTTLEQPTTRMQILRDVAARALDEARGGRPLPEVLTALVLAAEQQSSVEMLGSILLLDKDGVHLRAGAAPSLPAAYNEAINDIAIGPAVGSCGTACYYRQPVYVDDIKTDPVWADFRDLALSHGLRACWSTPIKDAGGAVLGAFANYYREPRHPRSQDHEAISVLTAAAAEVIALTRAR